jgi:GNAT superfamily N-acetyltransferase
MLDQHPDCAEVDAAAGSRLPGNALVAGVDASATGGGATVRAFQRDDTPEVLAVLRSAFGRWPRAVDVRSQQEFFEWKHLRSPFGRSAMLVAEVDGEVAGFLAYMPWRLQARGRPLAALREVDLAVHARHRRRGISMQLRCSAVFSPEVALLWSNPNGASRTGGAKLGNAQVPVSRFVRPNRPLRGVVRLARHAPQRHLPIDAPTVAEVLGGGAHEAPAPLDAMRAGERLATVRDLAYLRWRYGHFSDYRAVRLRPGKGAGGVAVFRCRRHGPFWVAHVCELLVAPGDRRAAGRLLRMVGEAATVDFVSCHFDGPGEAARHGFVPYRGDRALMARTLSASLTPDPARARSWALSYGDVELL